MFPNQQQIDARKFLDTIHGTDAEIHFICVRVSDDKAQKLCGRFQMVKNKLQHYNNQNYEIYYVVNSGGTLKQDIEKINAIFVDYDIADVIVEELVASRFSENKKELRKEAKRRCGELDEVEVRRYKDRFYERLQKFSHRPSMILETRNGLHAYWPLCNTNTLVEQFEDIEQRMIQYFQSDSAVSNVNRAMRVPDFNWMKNPDHPYMCKIVHYEENRYSAEELLTALPEYYGTVKKSHSKPQNQNSGYLSNLNLIQKLDAENLKSRLFGGGSRIIEPESKSISPTNSHLLQLHNTRELFDYLKKQNLRDVLHLYTRKFCCHIHDEANPSANIYQDKETGFYWYRCLASHCNAKLDIVNLVEHFAKCNTSKALGFLKKLFNVHIIQSQWQMQQKETIELNIQLLYDPERLKNIAEHTYKRIKDYIPLLEAMNQFTLQYLQTENFTDKQGNPLFYCDLKRIMEASRIKKDEHVSKRLGILTFLGLIRKVPVDELPTFLRDRAIHHAAIRNHKYITQYYSIPSYCYDTLSYSEQKTKEWREHHLSVKGFGRDVLLLTYGEEEANRVYPQLIGKKVSPKSVEYEQVIEHALLDLIGSKEYALESETFDYFRGGIERKKVQSKKVLFSILQRNNLVRKRATNQLKEKFQILSNGHPFIIFKAE